MITGSTGNVPVSLQVASSLAAVAPSIQMRIYIDNRSTNTTRIHLLSARLQIKQEASSNLSGCPAFGRYDTGSCTRRHDSAERRCKRRSLGWCQSNDGGIPAKES